MPRTLQHRLSLRLLNLRRGLPLPAALALGRWPLLLRLRLGAGRLTLAFTRLLLRSRKRPGRLGGRLGRGRLDLGPLTRRRTLVRRCRRAVRLE